MIEFYYVNVFSHTTTFLAHELLDVWRTTWHITPTKLGVNWDNFINFRQAVGCLKRAIAECVSSFKFCGHHIFHDLAWSLDCCWSKRVQEHRHALAQFKTLTCISEYTIIIDALYTVMTNCCRHCIKSSSELLWTKLSKDWENNSIWALYPLCNMAWSTSQ